MTPSPTIATTRPSRCSDRTASTLPDGRTPAITFPIPTEAATALAVCSLSPVRSTGSTPSLTRPSIASALESLTVSETESTATGLPSTLSATAVLPCSCEASNSSASRSGRAHPERSGFPTRTSRPSTVPLTPAPSRFRNSDTSGSFPTSSRAPSAIARAIGCSDAASAPPASLRARSRPNPSATSTEASLIWPVVSVPVLSISAVSTCRVDSRTSGPLISRPSWAPRPVPTRSASGVARPSAQGQAMISTETAALTANGPPLPSIAQKISVAIARTITVGTKIAEIRSASLWTGALPVWASSTSRAIWARAVSDPILVASTTSLPSALMLAPTTSSPASFSTGTDSPVRSDSSTEEAPSMTRPSVATFSPGRTTNLVPTVSSPTGTITSSPSSPRTATSLAPMSIRALRASPALSLALSSK